MSVIDAKKFYNEVMPTKQGDDYEYARWHKHAVAEVGYEQTKKTIAAFLSKQYKATHILELGPGAGTWSTKIRDAYPAVPMTVVDISREMLDRTKKVLGVDGVTYVETDFESLDTAKQYDLFVSSRVIEYMADKKVFVEKLQAVLTTDAHGLIITKQPHYLRMKLRGQTAANFHTAQISSSELVSLLTSVGLQVVSVRPTTVVVPLLKSAFANKLVGGLVQKMPLGLVSAVVESYAVEFKK